MKDLINRGGENVYSIRSRTPSPRQIPQCVGPCEDPLPRNPGGKLLKAQLREETDWGAPLR